MLKISERRRPCPPGANSAWHLQAVFLWKSNLSAPSCGCLEITWYLMAPSYGHSCEFVNNQVNSHSAFKPSVLNFKMLEIAIHEPLGVSSHLAGT